LKILGPGFCFEGVIFAEEGGLRVVKGSWNAGREASWFKISGLLNWRKKLGDKEKGNLVTIIFLKDPSKNSK